MQEQIKEAFSKVKEDIFSLGSEIQQLKTEILDLKSEFSLISRYLHDINIKITSTIQQTNKPTDKPTVPTHPTDNPTIQHIIPTHQEIPTHNLPSQALKSQNMPISTGNEGVPTDKPTNQQTNQHIIQHINSEENIQEIIKIPSQQDKINYIEKTSEILNNLDALKKELRRKFKALTSQEIKVFSLLYTLESQNQEVTYPLLSSKLSLSQSSVRDYIGKIQAKGIPIIKEKVNNKKILLHISLDLKKIATLDTILKLREI